MVRTQPSVSLEVVKEARGLWERDGRLSPNPSLCIQFDIYSSKNMKFEHYDHISIEHVLELMIIIVSEYYVWR